MSNKILSLILVGLAVAIITAFVLVNRPSIGSVAQSNEYHSVSFPQGSSAGSKLYPSTLGSVVITGANTGVLFIYNTTTTNVGLRALATSSLPVLAEIPASTAAGTYTFDIVATEGIAYEWTGTEATSTLTWR